MATLTFDFSGAGGLVERHQGDLNDTSPKPHLRYLGEPDQFADGIYNPFKKFGYICPSNNTFEQLTGALGGYINSIQYDPGTNIVYLSEEGEHILQLSNLDDTSVSNYLTVDTGSILKDMIIAEVNGEKALVYVIDSGAPYYENTSTGTPDEVSQGGMYVGYRMLDGETGINEYEVPLDIATYSVSEDFRRTINEDGSGNLARILAQSFTTQDSLSGIKSNQVSGVAVKLRRNGGDGVGVTMRISIQASESASSSPYTSRGAWSNAVTNYAVDDTVSNGGFTWQCIQAHDAAATANDEPGVGSNYESYWERFGSPDGTAIVSTTFLLSDVPVTSGLTGVSAGSTVDYNSIPRMVFNFDGVATLSPDTTYWIVIDEVGTNMDADDRLTWRSTANADYANVSTDLTTPVQGKFWQTATPWKSISTGQSDIDGFDFKLILNRDDDWSSTSAEGAFGVETGQNSFLYLADNGLIYWLVGSSIHSIDGSLIGGPVGTVNENLLKFASYITVTSVAETRSRMYLAVQKSDIGDHGDTRYFGADKVGVYIWDRRSQVVGQSDFIPCTGAKEIKALFSSSDGTVKALTVGNSGFSEIRGIVGNKYSILHTFEVDGFPSSSRGISQIDNLCVWLGVNGIFYAYGSITDGQPAKLFKIGDTGDYVATNVVNTGALLVGSDNSTPRLAVLFGLNVES